MTDVSYRMLDRTNYFPYFGRTFWTMPMHATEVGKFIISYAKWTWYVSYHTLSR